MFTKILVPVDGSPHAARAVSEAIDLAPNGRAELTLLAVVPDLSAWVVAGAGGAATSIDELTEQSERTFETTLEDAAQTVPASVKVSKLIAHGRPGPVIVDQVQSGGHDLVVMGMRGRGDVKSLLLGSVSHFVLHASGAATLIVHADSPSAQNAPA